MFQTRGDRVEQIIIGSNNINIMRQHMFLLAKEAVPQHMRCKELTEGERSSTLQIRDKTYKVIYSDFIINFKIEISRKNKHKHKGSFCKKFKH